VRTEVADETGAAVVTTVVELTGGVDELATGMETTLGLDEENEATTAELAEELVDDGVMEVVRTVEDEAADDDEDNGIALQSPNPG
jgi:phosphoribosylformylglycinamidine (FGAM) synthase PurS component